MASIKELTEEHQKWWKQRVEQLNQLNGWSGIDFRDQQILINAVTGTMEDVTYLLRLNTELIAHIEKLEQQGEVTTAASTDSSQTEGSQNANREEIG
jgi:type II secretory pathway component PulM